MVSRILVISIVPEGPLETLVADLKARYPSASITALVGAEPKGAARRASAEFLVWGSRPARKLIGELRGRKLIYGSRGRKKRDIDAYIDVLMRLSRLVSDLGDSLVELDINPLILYEKSRGAIVADVLVVLG